ncbi:hypothetical protein KM779_12405 [Clostridium tyrobutyricum]|nr:hypothetical protein [Clostridium tyrobutyricum]
MSMKTLAITGLLTLSISAPAFAAWHYSSITLPRTGYMTTTARSASGTVQKTQVTGNKYDVLSRVKSTNSNVITDWAVHGSGTGTVRSFYTGVKSGTSMQAQFKTRAVNYKTTTATIGWEP